VGQAVKNSSRICPLPPGPLKIGLSMNSDRKEAIVALGLITVLAISTLSTYLLWAPLPLQLTSHAPIEIDGDADFSATALLEGWPGDGSPENPYIIDRLNISGGSGRHGIAISNTQVSFIISNCSFHGLFAGMDMEAGIYLRNVTNGELIHNTFSLNDYGIYLIRSDSNTVSDNNCTHNGIGIHLIDSADSNTVSDNKCTHNSIGIHLIDSDSNTISGNNCTSNYCCGISIDGPECWYSIDLYDESRSSHSNIIANNTCNFNDIGIYLYESISNTVENNTFSGNTEQDIVVESELEE
jgi:parallel beta-helix repeat protein